MRDSNLMVFFLIMEMKVFFNIQNSPFCTKLLCWHNVMKNYSHVHPLGRKRMLLPTLKTWLMKCASSTWKTSSCYINARHYYRITEATNIVNESKDVEDVEYCD